MQGYLKAARGVIQWVRLQDNAVTYHSSLMAKSSKAWLRRHVTDTYVRQAKAAGYRSRAAYKLLEFIAKDKLSGPACECSTSGPLRAAGPRWYRKK